MGTLPTVVDAGAVDFFFRGGVTPTIMQRLYGMLRDAPVYVAIHDHSDKKAPANTCTVHITREPTWKCGPTPHGGKNVFAMAMDTRSMGYARRAMEEKERETLRDVIQADGSTRGKALILCEYALRTGRTLVYSGNNVTGDTHSGAFLYALGVCMALRGAQEAIASPVRMNDFVRAVGTDKTRAGMLARTLLRAVFPHVDTPAHTELPRVGAAARAYLDDVASSHAAPPVTSYSHGGGGGGGGVDLARAIVIANARTHDYRPAGTTGASIAVPTAT